MLVGLLLLQLSITVQAAYITDKLVAGLYKEAKVTDKPLKALNSGTPLEVVSRKNGFVKVRTADGTVGWVEATYLTDEKPARSILLDTQAKLSMLQKQLETLKGKSAAASVSKDGGDVAQWQDKLAKAQGQISQLEIQLKAEKLNNQKNEKDQQSLEQHKQLLAEQIKAESQAAMQALQQENQVLREQIQQVAQILSVPVADKEIQVVSHDKTAGLLDVYKDRWFWIVLAVVLISGFAGGFFYMRHRVTQRFGSVMKF